MSMLKTFRIIPALLSLIAATTFIGGCSTTKHVPDGEYLLDKVKIEIDGQTDATDKELYYFLRQTPNHKVLGFAKLQLSTYSLSG